MPLSEGVSLERRPFQCQIQQPAKLQNGDYYICHQSILSVPPQLLPLYASTHGHFTAALFCYWEYSNRLMRAIDFDIDTKRRHYIFAPVKKPFTGHS